MNTSSTTTTNKDDDDTNTSLTLANASRFPLMRRVDQHFTLQSKLENYGEEISRVSGRNKTALASLGSQERRIKEMQALLHGESSSSDQQMDTNNDTSQQQQQRGTITETKNGMLVRQTHQPSTVGSNSNADESDNNAIVATSSATDDTNNYQITSVPSLPTNFRVTSISHDSFTAVWDTNNDQQTIVDYEIKYSYSSTIEEGGDDQQQVQISCSRWCMKQPVPNNGRHQVDNLQPNTCYKDIAIRCRNSIGWSDFSNSINSITTTLKNENHDKRRTRFLYRIGHIEQSIQSHEAARQKLPVEQVLLARNMSRMQDRIDELDSEIERVTSHVGNDLLSSHLLHGAEQSFTRAALKYKLEQERTICRQNIAHWRAGIIDIDKESSEMTDEIQEKKSRLDERKAALLKFDKQYALVSSMKNVVSKNPIDRKRYYIAQWRSRVSNRLDVKQIIESLARSCRRRIYSVAWRQLCSLVSSTQEAEKKRRDVQADGIGGLLLNVAKCSVEENLSDASYLIGVVNDIKENHHVDDGVQRNGETPTTTGHKHLLCKEDKDLLIKGDFLFNARHYDSSLQSYQKVQSNIESPDYFTDTLSSSTKDIIALFAQVNGKIGHAYIKLCSFDLAIVYFGRQLGLADEEHLDVPRTEALLGLGMSYVGKYDYVYAETLLRRALDLCLSRDDQVNELLVYKQLQTCCECLNRPQEASALADKIQRMVTSSWERDSSSEAGTTIVSRKTVDHTLQELDNMRLRLINVIANQSQVVQLEVASAHRVHLQKTKSDKEQQLRDAGEQLSSSKQLASELSELISQIEYEIHEAKHTKKNRFISSLLQGSKQNVKTTELLIRLDEELKVVRAKHEDCLAEIPRIEMTIHNTRDDIHVLEEELIIEEGPLMQRVIEGRKYRCIALNAKKGDVDFVVSSEGSNCYVHSLSTGKLQHVFFADSDIKDGSDNTSSSTITALYFYDNHIYTGTMNSVLIGWDISTSKEMFVAKGHEAAITCIYADDSKIVSGSADKFILVWSKDGELLRRVGGHDHGIHALQCGPSFCVSASYSTVYVWDIVTEKRETEDKIQEFKCRGRLTLPEGHVTTLQYGELEVITGDSLGYVTVFWIESSEVLQRFKAHESAVTSIQVDATKSVSCGSDMVIVISDVIRGHVLQRLRGHASPILAVCFDRKQITSISSDGELRLWSWG